MAKKIINGVFVVGLILVLTMGLWQTYFHPRDILESENRYANQITPITLSSYLSGKYQNQMDLALADQVTLSQTYKKVFNQVSTRYLGAFIAPIIEKGTTRYIDFLGLRVFGNGYITYYTRDLRLLKDEYDAKLANLNQTFASHPDVDFYAYYLEMDHDMNFETGLKTGVYDYLRENLALPEDHISRLEITGFEDFARYFYKTDHHWAAEGSYEGYQEAAALLGVTEELLVPTDYVRLGSWCGTKATGVGAATFTEDFYACRYPFPALEITVDGVAKDYGQQEAYFTGTAADPVSYGNFYGWDDGIVAIHADHPDRENILLIGNSYDNAILKPLATHFNNTYAVDLRYYYFHMGDTFHFSQFLEERNISKVLLIGDVDYFRAPEFMLYD